MRKNQEVEVPPNEPIPAEIKMGLAGIIEKVFEKGRVFLLGYDLFISYRRADANDYALRLANRLTKRGFRCYLDQFSSPADSNLPREVKEALRHSTGLVLIGSPGALESKAIMEEVTIFSALSRAIIPVSVAGTLSDSAWGGRIAGISRTEETAQALRSGTPSRQVIIRLVDSASFRRRNDQLKRTFFGLLAVILLTILAGTAAAVLLGQKAAAAGRQAQDAERKRLEAVGLAQAAERQRKDVEENLATTRKELERRLEDLRHTGEKLTAAQENTRVAQEHERDARARAEEQHLIAEAKRREAERLGRVAQSRSLLAQAEGLRAAAPDSWAEPVDLAIKSYNVYPSSEPIKLLRNGLKHLARPLACIPFFWPVSSLTYSPDGNRLYAADANGRIGVLDATPEATAGKEIEGRTLGHNDVNLAGPPAQVPGGVSGRIRPHIVKLSADGRFAAAFYLYPPDHGLLEVSATDGTGVKLAIKVETKLTSIDLSADGSHIAATNGRRVWVWQVSNATPVLDVAGDDWRSARVTLSPSGRYVAATSDKFQRGDTWRYGLKLWSIETKELLLPGSRRESEDAPPEVGFVHVVAFSPSEEHLAFAVNSTKVHVYEMEKKAYVRSFDDTYHVSALAFHTKTWRDETDDMLAIGYDSSPTFGLVRFYFAEGERQIDEFNLWHNTTVDKIVFAPDNPHSLSTRVLTVTHDNAVHLWDIGGFGAKKIIAEVARINHDAPVSEVAVALPEGYSELTIATVSDGMVRLWEGPSDALTPFFYRQRIGAFLSRGRRFLSITTYGVSWLLSTETGESLTLVGKESSLGVARDGERLLSLYPPLIFTDMTTGRETTLPESLSLVSFDSISHDLRYFAVNDGKGRASVWRLDGETAAAFLPLGENVEKVAFSPDGEHFAIQRANANEVQVGSLNEAGRRGGGGVPAYKALPHSDPVSGIEYSEQGHYLAVTFGKAWRQRVALWNTSGRRLNTIECEGEVREIAFSENEKRLAVMCEGGKIQIYETAMKGAPLAVIEERKEARLLAFDSGGEHLAVAVRAEEFNWDDDDEDNEKSLDPTVWIWRVQAGPSKEPLSRIEFETGVRMIFFQPGDSKYLIALLQDRLTFTPWREADLIDEAKGRLSPDKHCPK
jgi:WD40 repeat protein